MKDYSDEELFKMIRKKYSNNIQKSNVGGGDFNPLMFGGGIGAAEPRPKIETVATHPIKIEIPKKKIGGGGGGSSGGGGGGSFSSNSNSSPDIKQPMKSNEEDIAQQQANNLLNIALENIRKSESDVGIPYANPTGAKYTGEPYEKPSGEISKGYDKPSSYFIDKDPLMQKITPDSYFTNRDAELEGISESDKYYLTQEGTISKKKKKGEESAKEGE